MAFSYYEFRTASQSRLGSCGHWIERGDLYLHGFGKYAGNISRTIECLNCAPTPEVFWAKSGVKDFDSLLPAWKHWVVDIWNSRVKVGDLVHYGVRIIKPRNKKTWNRRTYRLLQTAVTTPAIPARNESGHTILVGIELTGGKPVEIWRLRP